MFQTSKAVGAPTENEDMAAPGDPLARLVAADWLLPTSVPGIVGFSAKFEAVLAALQAALTQLHLVGAPGPSWYPPVVPRSYVERAQYTESFPHLLGSVHALSTGSPPGGSLGEGARTPTDAVLAPAPCHSIFAALADRALEGPCCFDLVGHCYRHEATSEIGRFRSFRVREFVAIGNEELANTWRAEWIDHCQAFFAELGIAIRVEAASDPFFGPTAGFMRSSQLEQSLKHEFVAPVWSGDPGTAITSVNLHKDHFGQRFRIITSDGFLAHSCCAGFGLERIVLALIHAHGDDLSAWPVLG